MSKSDEGANRPIVVSQGEPSGIGPEVAVKAFAALNGYIGNRPIRLVGSAGIFGEAARISGIDAALFADSLFDTGAKAQAEHGRPSTDNASGVTKSIDLCVLTCQQGDAAALVTAPIQKSVLTAAGFGFPGHTEYLAQLTDAGETVMMLVAHDIDPPLRVAPFTVHMPLAEIFRHLDAGAIAAAGAIVAGALARDFGCQNPRLAVAGLNPHAGENGTMGREDIKFIAPAVERLCMLGLDVIGPLPADTLFHADARRDYDAALCMYHDQALIPIKTLAFWSGVNVTLGLPIVRTSPDHGTALEIAGQGVANAESMIAAIRIAAEIAGRRGL